MEKSAYYTKIYFSKDFFFTFIPINTGIETTIGSCYGSFIRFLFCYSSLSRNQMEPFSSQPLICVKGDLQAMNGTCSQKEGVFSTTAPGYRLSTNINRTSPSFEKYSMLIKLSENSSFIAQTHNSISSNKEPGDLIRSL